MNPLPISTPSKQEMEHILLSRMKTFGEKKMFVFLLQKIKQNKKQAFPSLNLPKGNPCLPTHLQKQRCLFRSCWRRKL